MTYIEAQLTVRWADRQSAHLAHVWYEELSAVLLQSVLRPADTVIQLMIVSSVIFLRRWQYTAALTG